jgi:hypothetical protein
MAHAKKGLSTVDREAVQATAAAGEKAVAERRRFF